MKKCNKPVRSLFLVMLLLLILPLAVHAQTKKVSGIVTDETNEPLIGVTVVVPETTVGVTTDIDGRYTITLPDGKNQIRFSFLGCETQTLTVTGATINVKMMPQSNTLTDVVVIGYGTIRKSDLTGSVSNVSSKDFNAGVSSPEQLINGKVSGVQIMSNSGSPTAGSTIRIRGGASLNASNDPLIVLDGVPLESGGISGNTGNFLSLINPSDIESMSILKDASSTAIYGSRASNGVIIITTKKGTNSGLKVSFNTTFSTQTRTKMADMLSRNQFVDVINANGTADQKALLGDASTNWNDQIFRTVFGTDNNVSIAGRVTPNMPIRVSLGYYNQNGLLLRDNAERYTSSVSLSPSFLNDYLKFNFNVKGSLNNNQFANSDAIWAASTFNPTLPIYSGDATFGGYNEAIDNTNNPVNGGVRNPKGLVKQYDAQSKVKRVITNADVDYKMHFLPDLKFHTTLGYDYAEGKGDRKSVV